MAIRPVFLPTPNGKHALVVETDVEFDWHPGFAVSQKLKNIESMHSAASAQGISPILEVSSKSPIPLGRALSAFNLRIIHPDFGPIPVESAFQGSKAFVDGGPFTDLYTQPPAAAKKDDRLRASGALHRFEWVDTKWPLVPQTAFYDWMYLQALANLNGSVLEELDQYAGFTDLEFNPRRSINCQARSCALYVAIAWRGIGLPDVAHREGFIAVVDPQGHLF